MEKLLISMAASLIFRLFFEPMLLPEKRTQLKPSQGISQNMEPSKPIPKVMEAPKEKATLPDYVLRTPKDHFVGISAPSKSIQTARMSAINNAMEQIVRAMGVTCKLNYRDKTYGNVFEIKREIDDELRMVATWFVKEVEQNIVKTDFVADEKGIYTFFALVRFTDEKIEKMRRLTIGPKVMARFVGMKENSVRIEVAETNGIKVILYEYEIKAEKSYSRADFVSYYIWKVPKSSNFYYHGTLKKPVVLDGPSCTLNIPTLNDKTGIGDYLLGSSQRVRITFKGYDEIGREVVQGINISK